MGEKLRGLASMCGCLMQLSHSFPQKRTETLELCSEEVNNAVMDSINEAIIVLDTQLSIGKNIITMSHPCKSLNAFLPSPINIRACKQRSLENAWI